MSNEIKFVLKVDSKTGQTSISKFGSTSKTVLRDLKSGTDQANTNTIKLNKSIAAATGATSKLGSKASSLKGYFFALAGAAGIGAVIKGTIDLAMAQEDAELKMAAALRVSGDYTDKKMNSLKAYASGIQLVTTYGDEEVLMLSAMIKNLGVSSDSVENATTMVIGLAAKTDLSAQSLAKYVALAEQGDYTMLKRYIPALKLTTDATEQQKIVQDFANEGFKIAQERAGTFSGKLKQLTGVWGDVREEVGNAFVKNDAIIELLEDGKQTLSDWVVEVKNWVEANDELIAQKTKETINGIRESLEGVVGVYNKLPSGATKAGGAGIVGTVLFGPKVGVTVATLTLVNEQTTTFAKNVKKLQDAGEELSTAQKVGVFFGFDYKNDFEKAEETRAAFEKRVDEWKKKTAESNPVVIEVKIESDKGDDKDPNKKAIESDKTFLDDKKALLEESEKILYDIKYEGLEGEKLLLEEGKQALIDKYGEQEWITENYKLKEAALDEKIAKKKEESDEKDAELKKKLMEERTDATKSMYSDLGEMSDEHYEFQLEQIEKQRQDYIEETNDEVLANKWATAEKKKLLDQQLTDNGNFIDGIKLSLLDLSDSQTSWAERSKDIFDTVGSNFNDTVDNMIDDWAAGEDVKVDISELATDTLTDLAGTGAKAMKDAAINEVADMIAVWLAKGTAESGAEGTDWSDKIANATAYAAAAVAIIVGSKSITNNFNAEGGWISNHPCGGLISEGSHSADDVFLGETKNVNHWGMGGEYVINKKQTAKHRKLIESINKGDLNHAEGGPVSDWEPMADDIQESGMTVFFQEWAETDDVYKAIETAVKYYIALVAGTYAAKKEGSELLNDFFFSKGGEVGKSNVGYGFWGDLAEDVKDSFASPLDTYTTLSDPEANLTDFLADQMGIEMPEKPGGIYDALDWVTNALDYISPNMENIFGDCYDRLTNPKRIWEDIKGSLRTTIKPWVISTLTPGDYTAYESGVWKDWGDGWTDYYKDSWEDCLSFQKGGIVSGPTSGYPVTLHGTEAVIPMEDGNIPVKLLDEPTNKQQPILVNVYIGNEQLDTHITRHVDKLRVKTNRRTNVVTQRLF